MTLKTDTEITSILADAWLFALCIYNDLDLKPHGKVAILGL